jgi:hypothetical protein
LIRSRVGWSNRTVIARSPRLTDGLSSVTVGWIKVAPSLVGAAVALIGSSGCRWSAASNPNWLRCLGHSIGCLMFLDVWLVNFGRASPIKGIRMNVIVGYMWGA